MARRRSRVEPVPVGGPAWERWTRRAVVGLCILVSAWWMYDGLRALLVGDYVTPASGAYRGELGPWASLLEGLGIDPRSTGMKTFFVVAGALWFVTSAAYLQRPWLWRWLLILSLFSMWYLPVGTVAGLLAAVGLVFLHPVAERRQRQRLEARREGRA